MSKLSENILSLRKHYNLTQEDVALHIKISRAGYSMYERGEREPSVDGLIKLANLFQVNVDYLIGREVTVNDSTVQDIITMKNINQRIELATKEAIEQFIHNHKNEIKKSIVSKVNSR